jgi:hypothetical protein
MRSAALTLRNSDTNVAAWTSRTRLLMGETYVPAELASASDRWRSGISREHQQPDASRRLLRAGRHCVSPEGCHPLATRPTGRLPRSCGTLRPRGSELDQTQLRTRLWASRRSPRPQGDPCAKADVVSSLRGEGRPSYIWLSMKRRVRPQAI